MRGGAAGIGGRAWWRGPVAGLVVAGLGWMLACTATEARPAASVVPPAETTAVEFRSAPGDLLFQDLDCGPLCDAIERVTEGVGGAALSHVAIVSRVQSKDVQVVEAMGAAVREIPLSEFLARSRDDQGNPKVLVGRLAPDAGVSVSRMVAEALALVGKKYDEAFLLGDDAYYCAELVYKVVRRERDGSRIFEPAPMSFMDPGSGVTFPAWATYYEELGRGVPEGEPGLNPGALSRSPYVRLVHAYGRPAGFELPGAAD